MDGEEFTWIKVARPARPGQPKRSNEEPSPWSRRPTREGERTKVLTIALSCAARFGALPGMEPTEAEKKKGRRAQLLLYALMAILIGVPVVIYFLRSP